MFFQSKPNDRPRTTTRRNWNCCAFTISISALAVFGAFFMSHRMYLASNHNELNSDKVRKLRNVAPYLWCTCRQQDRVVPLSYFVTLQTTSLCSAAQGSFENITQRLLRMTIVTPVLKSLEEIESTVWDLQRTIEPFVWDAQLASGCSPGFFWNRSIDYDKYFEACEPSHCMAVEHKIRPPLESFLILLGLVGGLAVVSYGILRAYLLLTHACKKEEEPTLPVNSPSTVIVTYAESPKSIPHLGKVVVGSPGGAFHPDTYDVPTDGDVVSFSASPTYGFPPRAEDSNPLESPVSQVETAITRPRRVALDPAFHNPELRAGPEWRGQTRESDLRNKTDDGSSPSSCISINVSEF
eukprot:NODE_3009_length_1295_cov_117.200512_g2856_i0.p1 GENE.NODE_3009_length_1295_cov_117.200512_g2856_i0~~NODE_3009_length_1295_cov_117.200512_g2856_i0.p1  ORF type:complete len:372 (+),score=44.24 NODE_3009_length_1295_cov_117.200512_g2856_i0:58-1116(+)